MGKILLELEGEIDSFAEEKITEALGFYENIEDIQINTVNNTILIIGNDLNQDEIIQEIEDLGLEIIE